MSVVAAWTPTPLRSADMADSETHTPHHNVRVDRTKWASFGATTGQRNRSVWVNEFIDAVVDEPELWRDIRAIAEARNLPVDAVVNTALRQYRNRTRRVPGAQLPQRPEPTRPEE